MRASRQTELQREFPLHVVCSWLGNLPRIAQQSYLLVTEDDFARAAGAKKVMVEGGGVRERVYIAMLWPFTLQFRIVRKCFRSSHGKRK
jgi:hypothetical protein